MILYFSDENIFASVAFWFAIFLMFVMKLCISIYDDGDFFFGDRVLMTHVSLAEVECQGYNTPQ
jgi:hypothetical protein